MFTKKSTYVKKSPPSVTTREEESYPCKVCLTPFDLQDLKDGVCPDCRKEAEEGATAILKELRDSVVDRVLNGPPLTADDLKLRVDYKVASSLMDVLTEGFAKLLGLVSNDLAAVAVYDSSLAHYELPADFVEALRLLRSSPKTKPLYKKVCIALLAQFRQVVVGMVHTKQCSKWEATVELKPHANVVRALANGHYGKDEVQSLKAQLFWDVNRQVDALCGRGTTTSRVSLGRETTFLVEELRTIAKELAGDEDDMISIRLPYSIAVDTFVLHGNDGLAELGHSAISEFAQQTYQLFCRLVPNADATALRRELIGPVDSASYHCNDCEHVFSSSDPEDDVVCPKCYSANHSGVADREPTVGERFLSKVNLKSGAFYPPKGLVEAFLRSFAGLMEQFTGPQGQMTCYLYDLLKVAGVVPVPGEDWEVSRARVARHRAYNDILYPFHREILDFVRNIFVVDAPEHPDGCILRRGVENREQAEELILKAFYEAAERVVERANAFGQFMLEKRQLPYWEKQMQELFDSQSGGNNVARAGERFVHLSVGAYEMLNQIMTYVVNNLTDELLELVPWATGPMGLK